MQDYDKEDGYQRSMSTSSFYNPQVKGKGLPKNPPQLLAKLEQQEREVCEEL
jgi:hypothetical protein